MLLFMQLKDTSGLIICINEHKATCTNSQAKSTVSTKYLVTGGTQSIKKFRFWKNRTNKKLLEDLEMQNKQNIQQLNFK